MLLFFETALRIFLQKNCKNRSLELRKSPFERVGRDCLQVAAVIYGIPWWHLPPHQPRQATPAYHGVNTDGEEAEIDGTLVGELL